MIRGVLFGFLGGGVLGLVVAAVVSLVSPLPARVQMETNATAPAPSPEVETLPAVETPSEADTPLSAEAVAQTPDTSIEEDAAPEADLTPAPRPDPATIDDVEPQPITETPGSIEVAIEDPVLPTPQAEEISRPNTVNENITISLRPVQRPTIAVTETATLNAPEVGNSPSAPSTINVPEETTRAAIDPDQTDIAATAQPTATENAGQGSLLQAATDLDEAFPQLRSNRLPTVGSSLVAADASGVGPDSPLVQFAAQFERINQRPMLSVVLMDEGRDDIDLSLLREFPFPLSVAIDPTASDAAERARQFRSVGLEVLAILDLPEGAKPEDVEVNLGTSLLGLPESVAILEGSGIGLQENREVSDKVISFVKSSGHGLVMLPKGLNTAQKMAARDGVPSVTVFRDFDGKEQTEVIMRRFLDQAAFKARQEEGVLMLGRLRPDTLAALAVWTLADRASTVALAPASALLRNQTEG